MAFARPPNPESPALLPPWQLVALIAGTTAVVVLALYGWTLGGYFVGDDFGYVGRYHDFPWSRWPALFAHGWADGLFDPPVREVRPLHALSFIVDGKLWGISPSGYRLANLVLHVLVASTVGALAWLASARDRGVAIAAALLFAVHPVHAESVAWITARGDLLSTLFGLGSLLTFAAYRRLAHTRWLLATESLQTAALLSKESGITLLLFWLAADLLWFRPGRLVAPRTWLPYATGALVLAGYFLVRQTAFDVGVLQGLGGGPPALANPETYLRFLRHEIGRVTALLPPLDQFAQEWREPGELPFRRTILAGLAAIALAGVLGWLIHVWRRQTSAPEPRRLALLFGPGWFLIATVPLVMTYFSPRHLYPAAAGWSIFLALLLRGALTTPRAFAVGATSGGLLYVVFLGAALRPWHDTAIMSGQAIAMVRALERDHPGAPLVLDVPGTVDHAYCWIYAAPHALRPPFTDRLVDEHRPVFVSPMNEAFQNRPRDPRLLAALARTSEDGWLLHLAGDGVSLACTRIPAGRLHAATDRLRQEEVDAPKTAWRRFIARLEQP